MTIGKKPDLKSLQQKVIQGGQGSALATDEDSTQITLRLLRGDLAKIDQAAKGLGLPRAGFIRMAALKLASDEG